MEIFGISTALLGSQLLVGLINGSFYAILSLGLAIIFGLLNIINFAHGAQYMMGAFVAWIALTRFGINYWVSLIAAPLIVGIVGVLIERLMLRRLYKLDHLYGLLLTFGLALIFEGVFRDQFGISGESYEVPELLSGGVNLGFMFLPIYRGWVIIASLTVCFGTWYMIERTKLGAYLRAGTENSAMVQALGINVPLLITFTYGYGVALAAFAGVLAAPIFQVNPLMGSNLIIVVFRRGRHRRHGFNHGLHPDRPRPRPDRRPDQSDLSGSLQRCRLRHHGHCSAGPPGRSVRQILKRDK
jgi:branched-chain amino acid transport system permease protein